MNLVINKCVTAVKVSNFSGHYLRNRSTLDTLPKFCPFLLGHPVYKYMINYNVRCEKHEISEKYLRYPCCRTQFQHRSKLIQTHGLHRHPTTLTSDKRCEFVRFPLIDSKAQIGPRLLHCSGFKTALN